MTTETMTTGAMRFHRATSLDGTEIVARVQGDGPQRGASR